MEEQVSSFYVLVPGPWTSAQGLAHELRERGLPMCADDEELPEAGMRLLVIEEPDLSPGFAWGPDGPTDPAVIEAVAQCPGGALVEVGQTLDQCVDTMAALGRALLELGGVAVRMEGSGAASSLGAWIERLESGSMAELFLGAVLMVHGEEETFTSGMHHFGRPDAILTGLDPEEATAWLMSLCLFQLEEEPVLGTGHTFAPAEDVERRVLERWPDGVHHPDDGRHNPFGMWVLLPMSDDALEAQDPVPVIMPSLAAMLAAAERSKGEPLTQDEVEGLVDKAPAIAMDAKDAMSFERRRGYADIEPRRAWPQWQIVREGLD